MAWARTLEAAYLEDITWFPKGSELNSEDSIMISLKNKLLRKSPQSHHCSEWLTSSKVSLSKDKETEIDQKEEERNISNWK